MATLRTNGVSQSSPVYADLLNRESQIATALVLQAGTAPRVVQPAAGASQIRPRPKRSALLGLALGAILGIGLAFLRDALDKKTRSDDEIHEILRLPLLGRLAPPRELAAPGRSTRDARGPEQPSGRAGSQAPDESRVRQPRARAPDDHDHVLRRAGGQVDDCRQSRCRSRTRPDGASRSSTSTSAGLISTGSSASRRFPASPKWSQGTRISPRR